MYFQNVPNAPALETLVGIFKDNPIAGILAVVAFLLCFLVVVKSGDILSFFKERGNKKDELEARKIDLDQTKHDETIAALGNMTKVVENNTHAINAVEKTILSSEARTAEKFSNISKDILTMESRLSDKIVSAAKDAERGSKLDKIAASLDKLDGGEDSCDGVHSGEHR